MQKDVNESNTNRTSSSSSETIDSIQAAFASLDAASNLHDKSISQLSNVNSSESRHERLRARPRQSLTDEFEKNDDAFRPLCGGPTKAEMLMRSKQAKRISAHHHERGLTDDSSDVRPSHVILSSPQPWQGAINAIQEPEECTMATRTVESNTRATAELEKEATITALRSGSVENSPKKKRTLAWAAKRDRRNARRRPSPPLTRRRAALAATDNNSLTAQTEDVENQQQDENQALTLLMPDIEPTAEITDPSNSDKTNQDSLKRDVGGRKATKTSKSALRIAPQLDMTLTEPSSPQQHDDPAAEDHALPSATTAVINEAQSAQSRIHDQSSDTESDGEGNAVRSTVLSAISSGSNTEDEQEMLSVNNNANEGTNVLGGTSRIRVTKAVKRKWVAKQGRKEPKKAVRQAEKQAGNPTEKVAVEDKGQKKRSKKDLLRGRPLFEGLVFVLIGYWTKVKMYEKLIEKHAGTLVKSSQPVTGAPGAPSAPLLPQFDHGHLPDANPEGITHIVYCPHSMYTPDPKIVRDAIVTWKKEAGKEFNLQNIEVVDSRWISDCISNCLRKEDLLSVREYLIAV